MQSFHVSSEAMGLDKSRSNAMYGSVQNPGSGGLMPKNPYSNSQAFNEVNQPPKFI